jgi:hypothetical protein
MELAIAIALIGTVALVVGQLLMRKDKASSSH